MEYFTAIQKCTLGRDFFLTLDNCHNTMLKGLGACRVPIFILICRGKLCEKYTKMLKIHYLDLMGDFNFL